MSAAGQSLEMKPGGARGARARLGEIRPAPEISSTLRVAARRAQPLADLGARLLADEQVDERDVRLVAAAPARSPPSPLRALRQRSTHGCSPSISRKPQCTTSWSSTTSTRRRGRSSRAALAPFTSGRPAGTASRTRQRARLALAELDDAAVLERLERREPQAHARSPGAAARGTPSLRDLQRRTCRRRACTRDLDARRVGVLARVAHASASTDCASGSSCRGHRRRRPASRRDRRGRACSRASRSTSSRERRAGLRAARRRAGAERARAGRRARPAAPRGSARAPRRSSGRARAEHAARRRTAAGSRPRGSRARGRCAPAAARARSCWRVAMRARRGQRGGLAERPQQVALAVGQRRPPPRSERITPSQRPAGGDRRADERGDPEQRAVARGHLALDRSRRPR